MLRKYLCSENSLEFPFCLSLCQIFWAINVYKLCNKRKKVTQTPGVTSHRLEQAADPVSQAIWLGSAQPWKHLVNKGPRPSAPAAVSVQMLPSQGTILTSKTIMQICKTARRPQGNVVRGVTEDSKKKVSTEEHLSIVTSIGKLSVSPSPSQTPTVASVRTPGISQFTLAGVALVILSADEAAV